MGTLFRGGGSDTILFGNPTALDPSFPWTVAAILEYRGNVGPTGKILSRGLTLGLRGWSLGVNLADGALFFTKYGVADIFSTLSLGFGASLNRRWFCGAFVSSTNVRFWIKDLTTPGALTFQNVANAGAFAVGAADNFRMMSELINGSAAARHTWGELEAAAVWKASPSDAQIEDLLYGGLASWYSMPSSPLSLWQLDQSFPGVGGGPLVVDEGGVSTESSRVGTVQGTRSVPEWCGGVAVGADTF